MRVLGPVVGVALGAMPIQISYLPHGREVRPQPVRHDNTGTTITLHRLPQEPQGSHLIAFLSHEALEGLSFMIDRTP